MRTEKQFTLVCSWCSKKQDILSGKFLRCDPQQLVGVAVSHTICPECAKAHRETIRLETEFITRSMVQA